MTTSSSMKYAEGEKGRTRQHYDLAPAVFELFLDPYLKYSSGFYTSSTDTLTQAQVNKMEFIARQLDLKGGEQLLDIGCGWGSLLIFLAECYACQGWGITPASKQVDYLLASASKRGVGHLVTADVSHFQETKFSSGKFDAITLVGSIVHMDDRVGVLQESYQLLKPGCRIYISETCFRNRQKHAYFSHLASTNFVRDEVFGWGDMVPLSVIIAGLEDAGFSLTSLTDLTNHYYRTIEDWMRNIVRNRGPLESIEQGIADKLLRLFEIANAGWGFTAKHYAVVATKRR